MPIEAGETETRGSGDEAAVREMADRLTLSTDANAAPLNLNRIECDKLRGQYSRQGLAGSYMCVLSYSDGGKICRRGSDCIGECRVQGSNFDGPTGVCQANTVPFGCFAKIDDDGKVGPAICVD